MKLDLKTLRELPVHTRTQIAFSTATAVVAVIALVWSTTLGSRFQEEPVLAEVEPKKAAMVEEKEKSAWGEFFGDVRTQLGNILSAFGSIRIETGNDDSRILRTNTD